MAFTLQELHAGFCIGECLIERKPIAPSSGPLTQPNIS